MNPNLKKLFSKKNKYGATKQKCNLGHHHPSTGESMYCFMLQQLAKDRTIESFEYAKKYELRVNGILVGSHKPDFTVTTSTRTIEVHEYKGFETPDWHLRRNLFVALYPHIPYITVK